jgi:precorrin-6Y C5,15-methyltransferase (decarboxylating)
MQWEDMALISNHGKDVNYLQTIIRNKKTFMLLGKKGDVQEIAENLLKNNLENVHLYAGENLSYPEEKIITGRPEDFLNKSSESLSVLVIVNEDFDSGIALKSIRDEMFIRGEVPMTKEEIRTLSISKMNLKNDSLIYDIGGGTGSVSVEMALKAHLGKVVTIEQNEKALELIMLNTEKFGVTNIEVINEKAPLKEANLLIPTHGFIGGSGGNMQEILEWLLEMNPCIRIVINTVTLESIGEVMESLKKLEIKDLEITQVMVSKDKKAGNYHLMTAHNPVYIISFYGGGNYEPA